MFNEQETPFATFRAGRSTHVQEGTDEALQLFFHVDREIDARHAARLTASLATGAVTAVPSTSTQAAWLLYEMGLSKRLNSPLVSSAMPSAPGLLAMTGDQGPGAAHPARPIARASSIWQHHRWQLRQTVSPSAPQSAPSITSSVAPSGHVSRAARTWRSSSTALNDRTMQPGLCVNSSISSFISSFSSVAASVHTSVATSVHTSVNTSVRTSVATSVPRTLDPSGSPSANEGRNQHAKISLDPSRSPTAVAEVDQAAKIVPKKASKGSARPTSAPNLEPNLEQDLKPSLGSNPFRNSSLNRNDTCLLEDAHDDAKSLSMSLPLASPAASPAAMHIVMPDFMPSSLRAFSSGNGARPLTEVAPWTLTNHAPAPSRSLLPSPSSYVSRAHALTTAGSPTAGSTAGNTAGSTAGSSTLASRAPSYLIHWAPSEMTSEMTSETQSLTQSPHRQPPHPSLVTNPRPGTTINLTNPRPSTTINRSLESIHTSQPRARLKSVPQHQSSPKLTPAGTQMTGDGAHYGALSRPHSASTGATPSVKAALRTYALNHATIATSILPQPRLVTRLG